MASITKHLDVHGITVQIYISWSQQTTIALRQMGTGYRVYVGALPMVDALRGDIDKVETHLQQDEAARHRFKAACQRTALLNANETAAWRRLAGAARR
jgi:hypothetical protein